MKTSEDREWNREQQRSRRGCGQHVSRGRVRLRLHFGVEAAGHHARGDLRDARFVDPDSRDRDVTIEQPRRRGECDRDRTSSRSATRSSGVACRNDATAGGANSPPVASASSTVPRVMCSAPMMPERRATHSSRSSRTFQTTARIPSGRSTRAISASAGPWSNQ